MNCTTCYSDTKVIDSRIEEQGVRRRRECLACGARFTTMEVTMDQLHQARTKPAPAAKPKPKPAPKPAPTKKARADARRRIEDRREFRDVWTPDNDYLPDY